MKKLFFIFLAIMLNGCATIFTGTSDTVLFESQPPGAIVYVDGKKIGTTDNSISIDREFKDYRIVTLSKDGYRCKVFRLEQEVVPAYYLGIFGLGLPFFIDMATGAAARPMHDKVVKKLEKYEK